MTATTDTYYEWLDKLEALMNWHAGEDGQTTWTCGNPEIGDRFALAKQAAEEIGADFDTLLTDARANHGRGPGGRGACCCDCELILNCDDRPEEEA